MKREDREALLERANEEWARILEDPIARAEAQAEQELWDATLADGLDDEDWEPIAREEQAEQPCN
jgi:hypothetical protein